jgi:hypothetical protein
MQAQRKEAQSPEESGPKQVENQLIPEANHLSSVPNTHGPRHKAHRRTPTEDGHDWAQAGCSCTPSLPTFQRWFPRFGPDSTYLEVSLVVL